VESVIILDLFLVLFVSFIIGVMMGFHPIIALGATLCAVILKVIVDLLEFEFSEE
jgi:hypothetical protein